VLLEPYMPQSVEKLLDALGAPANSYAAATFSATGPLTSGVTVSSMPPLFPKMPPAN